MQIPGIRNSSFEFPPRISGEFEDSERRKLNQPPRPTTSLKLLVLPPSVHPPRFTCVQCASTNTFIPFCISCSWTAESLQRGSAERHNQYRQHAPAITDSGHPTPVTPNLNHSILTSSSPTATENASQECTVLELPISTSVSGATSICDPDSSNSKQKCVGVDGIADRAPPIIPMATDLHSAFDRRLRSDHHQPARPRRPPPLFFIDPKPTSGGHHSRLMDMSLSPPPSSSLKHTRSFSSPIVLSLAIPQDGEVTSSSIAHGLTRPTLRRKRRMSYIHATISTHLRADNLSTESCPDSVLKGSHHFSIEKLGHPVVRLGHPSRPYYNAIRKNMSRSTTSCDDGSRASSPSPTSSAFMRSMTTVLLDSDQEDVLPSFGTPSPAFSCSSHGFSLSGETEMRMALAAQRSKFRPSDRPEYVFVDTPKSRSGSGVKRLKKLLGNGIKRLVLRRKS